MDELLSLTHAIAKAHGMGPYFDCIRSDIERLREKRKAVREEKDRNPMKSKLDLLLKDDKYIVVNCKSGVERRYVHEYAEEHGLQSCAVKTKLFEVTYIYKCTECKGKYYYDELNVRNDWASDGYYFGEMLDCPCGEAWIPSGEETSDELQRKPCFNAVLLGTTITLRNKRRLHKTKNIPKAETRAEMVERDIIVLECVDNDDLYRKLFLEN